MAVLDTMTLRFEGDINPLKQALRQAEQAVREGSKNISDGLTGVDRALGQLKAAALAYISVDFAKHLYETGRRALDAAGNLGEMAEAAGVTTGQLQVLIAAGATAGVKTDAMTLAMGKFSKSLATAATDGGSAAAAFNKLGVATQSSAGGVRDTMKVLLDTAEAISKITSPAERVQAAMEIFGRGGAKLVPLLSQGAAGFNELAKKAQEMGLILSDETVKAADETADKLALLDLKSERLTQRIATALMPTIVELTIKLKEMVAVMVAAPTAMDTIAERIERFQFLLQRMPSGPARENLLRQIGDLEEQRRRLAQGATILPTMTVEADADPGRMTRGENDPVAKMIRDLESQVAGARLGGIAAEQNKAVQAAREAAKPSNLGLSQSEETRIRDLVREKTAVEDLRQARAALAETEAKRFDAQQDGEERSKQIMQEREQARLRMNFDLEKEVKNNEALIAAVGKSNEAYQIEITLQQIREDFRRKGIPLLEEEEARYRAIAETLGKQKQKIDDLKAANDSWRQATLDATRAIGTAFEDAIIKGSKLSDVIRALTEDLQRIALRALVTKPLEAAFTNLVNGSGGTAAAGGGGFGQSLSTIGSALSLGNIVSGGGLASSIGGFLGFGGGGLASSALPNAVGGAGAQSVAQLSAGFGGGASSSLLSALPFVGSAFGLYSATQSQSRLGGAAMGALAGMPFGPIGMAGGALFGGLMAGKPSVGPNGNAFLGFSGGQFGVGVSSADNGYNPAGPISEVQKAADAINKLMTTPGVMVDPSKFDPYNRAYGVGDMSGQRTGSAESIIQALMQNGAISGDQRLIGAAMSGGNIDAALAQIQGGELAKSIDALIANAARMSDAFDKTAMQLQDTQDSLKLDSQLSPLLPGEMLAEAQSQFSAAQVAAQGGDLAAYGRAQNLGRGLLSVSQDYYGRASGQYRDQFNSVEGTFASLQNSATSRAGFYRSGAGDLAAAQAEAASADSTAAVAALTSRVDALVSKLGLFIDSQR